MFILHELFIQLENTPYFSFVKDLIHNIKTYFKKWFYHVIFILYSDIGERVI